MKSSINSSKVKQQNESSAKVDEQKESLDNSIDQLNKILIELRKNRQKFQEDEKMLNNRNKILNLEKNKSSKKMEIILKNQEKKDKIRVNMNKDKINLEERKKKNLMNLADKKNQVSHMKNEVDKSLTNWKNHLINKGLAESHKMKRDKKYIKNLINEKKEQTATLNKQLHDMVQSDRRTAADLKKNEEYQKRLQLKKDIQEQINKELELKNELEEKIHVHQKQNQEIIDKIHKYNKKSKSQSNIKTLRIKKK
jgi:hypothetical protein